MLIHVAGHVQDMQHVVAMCLERDPKLRPTASQLLHHRFFKWNRGVAHAVDEILAAVPSPVQRLTSLTRRSRENLLLDDETNAADERISFPNLQVITNHGSPVLSDRCWSPSNVLHQPFWNADDQAAVLSVQISCQASLTLSLRCGASVHLLNSNSNSNLNRNCEVVSRTTPTRR